MQNDMCEPSGIHVKKGMTSNRVQLQELNTPDSRMPGGAARTTRAGVQHADHTSVTPQSKG